MEAKIVQYVRRQLELSGDDTLYLNTATPGPTMQTLKEAGFNVVQKSNRLLIVRIASCTK